MPWSRQWLQWRGRTQITTLTKQYPMFVVAALSASRAYWTIAWGVAAFATVSTAQEAIPISPLWHANDPLTQLRRWHEQFLPIHTTRAFSGYGMATILSSTFLKFRLIDYIHNMTMAWDLLNSSHLLHKGHISYGTIGIQTNPCVVNNRTKLNHLRNDMLEPKVLMYSSSSSAPYLKKNLFAREMKWEIDSIRIYRYF